MIINPQPITGQQTFREKSVLDIKSWLSLRFCRSHNTAFDLNKEEETRQDYFNDLYKVEKKNSCKSDLIKQQGQICAGRDGQEFSGLAVGFRCHAALSKLINSIQLFYRPVEERREGRDHTIIT